MTADELIAFEQEIAGLYEAGLIKAPVHLSGGSEAQLIDIFKGIKPEDWVLSSWRNHYHALLHGLPPNELKRQILAGRSMFINDAERRFYASSIVGGTLPIAVGLAMAIRRKGEDRKVWCFVGDMTSETGAFYEAQKYAFNFKLPVTFVIEDNSKSVLTETRAAWGGRDLTHPVSAWDNVIRYEYELTWPHSGVGKWVAF